MSNIKIEVRVTSVRSRGKAGGAIFAGKSDTGSFFVVLVDYSLLPESSFVERAQVWSVQGALHTAEFELDGRKRNEQQIAATRLELVRPSGNNLVDWIAQSPECPGIGAVRARRLWDTFGVDLPEVIDAGDLEKLAPIVGTESAVGLVSAFKRYGHAQTLLWLDQMGIPQMIGVAVARYWGEDARERIRADPYSLCSFCASWPVVDKLSRARFSVSNDDPRRLVSASEETLHRAMAAGETALSVAELRSRAAILLDDRGLAEKAIQAAVIAKRIRETDGLLQASGIAFIEAWVASSLHSILLGSIDGQGELLYVDTPAVVDVERTLSLYESMQSLTLTSEQRQAVITSSTCRLSVITGGAGTGKTTCLKALRHVLERHSPPGAEIHQLALAGRAAKRMEQSTGARSQTIASFLLRDPPAAGSTVVIDESSMVDVLLMYRVLRHLPQGVRLVLVGDEAQLPPIGPGLVLHALLDQSSVPHTRLRIVKRQSGESGIPQIATAIREHRQPLWTKYTGLGSGVSIVSCSARDLDDCALQVYEELGGRGLDYSVQVVTPTRRSVGGMINLNRRLHERHAPRHTPVRSVSAEWGTVNERTADGEGLFVGDLIMYGANDDELALSNGSLGRIVEALLPQEINSAICIAEFDGERKILSAKHMMHVMHSYAFTIHKAQGSEFARVIVPIRRNRLLDNALIYTAVTRGVDQVVIVGDCAAAEAAIFAATKSSGRKTLLPTLLRRQ